MTPLSADAFIEAKLSQIGEQRQSALLARNANRPREGLWRTERFICGI
jgi:hypothetical protein